MALKVGASLPSLAGAKWIDGEVVESNLEGYLPLIYF